jgi:hypothetical protein
MMNRDCALSTCGGVLAEQYRNALDQEWFTSLSIVPFPRSSVIPFHFLLWSHSSFSSFGRIRTLSLVHSVELSWPMPPAHTSSFLARDQCTHGAVVWPFPADVWNNSGRNDDARRTAPDIQHIVIHTDTGSGAGAFFDSCTSYRNSAILSFQNVRSFHTVAYLLYALL